MVENLVEVDKNVLEVFADTFFIEIDIFRPTGENI
jgi:hypothetical protein